MHEYKKKYWVVDNASLNKLFLISHLDLNFILFIFTTHTFCMSSAREGLGPVSADRTPPAIDVDDDDVSPSSHSVCNSLTQTPAGRVYTRVCNLYIYIYIWLTLSNGWHRHTFTSLFGEKKPPPPPYTRCYNI